MVDNTKLMVELMRKLRPEMNGAVSGAMEERGLHYGLNYGVSLPTIRKIAGEYSPNHEFGKFLYQQQVRELRISAMYIAQSHLIKAKDESFWRAGIQTNEYAEIIAMTLIGRSPECAEIVSLWLDDPREVVQYAALMSGARCGDSSAKWNWGEISTQLRAKTESSNVMILRGIALFLTRLLAGSSPEIETLVDEIQKNDSKSCLYISGEMFLPEK